MTDNDYCIEDPKNHIIFIGCTKCGYSKYHINSEEINHFLEFQNVEFSKYHFTCICDLFDSSIICCIEGYQNLLFALPFIAVYSPVPSYTTENLFINARNELAISISRTEYVNLNCIALNIKLEAIKTFHSNNKKKFEITFSE